MKNLNDFKKDSICQSAMYTVNGGKITGPGTKMLDDVEMCFSKDRMNRKGEIKKYKDLQPCDCECND